MIPLHPSSQPLFAFTWTDPITYHTQQLTWTVLPQGFTFLAKPYSSISIPLIFPQASSSSMWMSSFYAASQNPYAKPTPSFLIH
jgi:hypothetical protein